MSSHDYTCYAMWEVTPPRYPPRSHLYHLAPMGLGTADTEGFASYLARLAEYHQVTPKQLILRKIWPLVNARATTSPYVYTPQEYYNVNAFWRRNAQLLNAATPLTQRWVQVVEQLTLRTDLKFLTMLPWGEAISALDRLRSTRAWCPVCYAEWQATDHPLYDPLLWSLKMVTICPRHQQRLWTQCPYPDCQCTMSWLMQQTRPGYCAKCGRWLGLLPETQPAITPSPLSPAELAWQLWVTTELGQLIASAPQWATLPTRAHVSRAISTCLEQLTGGSINQLAHRLHVAYASIQAWQAQTRSPQLPTLLKLCYQLHISLVQFLSGNIELTAATQEAPPALWPLSKPPQSPRPFDVNRIQQALEEILARPEEPPPSLTEVGRRLGYAHEHLRKRFPQLCQAISAKYRQYRRDQSREKHQQIGEQVRQAVLDLHAQGIYPSANQITKHLGSSSYVRTPGAHAIRLKTLRELGWLSALDS